MTRPDRLCLVAGAGAGKTYRLVEHYQGLLERGLEPAQIVAITFTEKAAGEMRQRIGQKVDPELAAKLAWAPINTIHGFCASLLREYGLALGLDPEFRVLDADEFGRLLQETIAEALRQGLKERDPALGRLLAHFNLSGKGGLRERLGGLHGQLATMGISPEQAAQATAMAHAADQASGHDLLSDMDQLLPGLSDLVAQKKVKADKAYGQKIIALLTEWEGLRAGMSQNPPKAWAWGRTRELCAGNWYAANAIRQELVAALERYEALAAIPAAAKAAADLLELAAKLEAGLSRELTRRAALGFDALLLLARDLLRDHPEVLVQCRQRWRALLVDEYQDVNPVQNQLVELLAGLGHDPAPQAEPPALLVVGDRKQSIYAFRGAEVAELVNLAERLEKGAGRVEPLGQNWRSHPALVEFFNRLFAQVLTPGPGQEHAPQAYVEYGPHDRQEPSGKKPGDLGDVVVELVDCKSLLTEDKPSADAQRAVEARALAAYLRGLFDQSLYHPGQVAVLLRKLTQVGVYEEALRRAGVDFYTVGGRGFFERQEISDLAHALRAILDPQDEIALAAWLRSPLVGLSDESLLTLAHPRPPRREGLHAGLMSGSPLPDWCEDGQSACLDKARRALDTLGPLARRLHPAELLTLLLEDSDLLPVLMGTGAGEQKVANLRKLLESARQPGGVLAGGMEAFARGLAGLVADPPKDAQAPLLGEEARVVRIMSVHQAKGLEFPVVVLPDLAGKDGGNSRGPDLGPGGELVMAPPHPDSGAPAKPPLYDRLQNRDKARQEAEDARKFYVACTRAEERLVLITSPGGTKSKGWDYWARELVATDPAARLNDAAKLPLHGLVDPSALADAWPGDLPGDAGAAKEEAAALLARIDRPAARLSLVRESVSGLENYLACPRLYVLTQCLGLDTAFLPRPGQAGGGGSPRAVELGSLVHRFMEVTDFAQGPAGLERALASLEHDPDLADQALSLATRLWDTELPGLLDPTRKLERELPFCLHLPGLGGGPALEMIGEIDLAARLDTGWLVADYKVTAKADPMPYRDQMALYALALYKGEGGQGPAPRCCLVFLSPQGAKLSWLEFTAADLEEMDRRVRAAAQGIAALGPQPDPATLPSGPGCDPSHCPVAALCGLEGGP
ncbi:MAG: UvrD-helicase domain-containing protein [Proteobacteria bacterium]|nr:UvrD-helicase domain-containing protein [Pseudomonadota bacterium]MBU1451875.1 UvrD-helicase domain-containing protein [Pseudomonadota bacterium]MBU2468481.1 UvrD-helicase domain-containing protein [Pseudomonadota bacterium]MBU2515974.1 UvrD-helicase domain-containing protein [Pseudomonadota bacterium]